jgi:hypothetical protein
MVQIAKISMDERRATSQSDVPSVRSAAGFEATFLQIDHRRIFQKHNKNGQYSMNQPWYPGIRNTIPSDLLKLTFAAPLRLKTPIITAVTINAYINGTTTLLKYLTIGANCISLSIVCSRSSAGNRCIRELLAACFSKKARPPAAVNKNRHHRKEQYTTRNDRHDASRTPHD